MISSPAIPTSGMKTREPEAARGAYAVLPERSYPEWKGSPVQACAA